MYIIDENDREYHFGDRGPKYLMKGPRMDFALVQFLPGQDFKAHPHNIMEENFCITEEEIDTVVDDVVRHLTSDQFIHIEPHETHYCINHYDKPMKVVSTLAPYQEVDKIKIENCTYDGKQWDSSQIFHEHENMEGKWSDRRSPFVFSV